MNNQPNLMDDDAPSLTAFPAVNGPVCVHRLGVIHHSNYRSEEEMKVAISRHFVERNNYFLANPKRAGKKIWDVDFFTDYATIRSGDYREW